MWDREEQEMSGEHREKNDTKHDGNVFHEDLRHSGEK